MKIVCLIQSQDPLIWFANEVNKVHPLALVVVEEPVAGPGMLNKIRRGDWRGVVIGVQHRLEASRLARRGQKERERVLGTGWDALDSSIPMLKTTSVNDSSVQQRLSELEPDLIIVHGTSLVKNHIIATASAALNLHWGLSPYYRGGRCTELALICGDVLNIGVTIHALDSRIDGGDIVAQARADVAERDSVYSINLQLTRLGTEQMIRAIDRLQRGLSLVYQQQTFGEGVLFNSWHWSPFLHQHIRSIERRGGISKMVRRPSRRVKLPIVDIADP